MPKKLTKADEYRRIQKQRMDASGFWHERDVQKAVEAAVEKALGSPEYIEGDEIQIGIASGESFLHDGGYISFSSERSGFDQEVEFASKAAEQNTATPMPKKQISSDDADWYDEVIQPPWNFDHLQLLMATSTMHASCVETKSSDYAYSGWELQPCKQVEQLIKREVIAEDDVKRAREEVENFLSTCVEGGPIEDACRDMAMEHESLGTGALEPIRDQGALVTQLRLAPFRTIRYLSSKSSAYKNGATYCQRRGETKRYFAKFGDLVQYADDDFDPLTASYDKFPDIDINSRRSFVQWRDKVPSARTGESIPFDINESAGEFIVVPRRPFTLSDMYGTPAGIQAMAAMKALKKIEEYNLQFFSAKGVPQYAVVIKGLQKGKTGAPGRAGAAGARGHDDIAKLTRVITEYFTNRITRADRSVLVMRLFGDVEVKFEKLSSEEVEASFADYESRMKEDVRLSHRIPPAAMGINEDTANIGSGRDSTQMRRYRDHIVVPGQRQIASVVNRVIRVGLLIPYFEFKFKPIDLNEEKELREFHLEMARIGAATTDEVRRAAPGEFPPLGKANGGDVRMFPPGTTLIGLDESSVSAAVQRTMGKNQELAKGLVQLLTRAGYMPQPAKVPKKKPKKATSWVDRLPTRSEEEDEDADQD